jgi:hypothetical protein
VRAGDKDDGLAWKYEPPKLQTLEEVQAQAQANGGSTPTPAPAPADPNDPLQMPTNLAGVDIPDVGRPIEITIKTARGLVDSKGAAIIDAREAADYAAGHIPGAVNLPFDEVITDPARLEAFRSEGEADPRLLRRGDLRAVDEARLRAREAREEARARLHRRVARVE